jgi:PEP-CTERM motif
MTRKPLVCALAVTAAAITTAPAYAARTLSPNYTFPDGSKGFALATPGEIVPCVYVGFVALDAPLGFPATQLLLGNSGAPVFHNPPTYSQGYVLHMAFTGGGSGRLASPAVPTRGVSGLIFDLGTRDMPKVYDLQLSITGPGDITSWAAFNPQPDPPGFWFSQKFGFDGTGDTDVQFALRVNGVQQDFHLASVPEPANWALMIAGFGLVGGAIRRRQRVAVAWA